MSLKYDRLTRDRVQNAPTVLHGTGIEALVFSTGHWSSEGRSSSGLKTEQSSVRATGTRNRTARPPHPPPPREGGGRGCAANLGSIRLRLEPLCRAPDPEQGSGFRVQGSGFRVQGSGCRVQGSGFRVQGSGCRVRGSGFTHDMRHVPAVRSRLARRLTIRDSPTGSTCVGVWGSGFRVWGSGFRV